MFVHVIRKSCALIVEASVYCSLFIPSDQVRRFGLFGHVNGSGSCLFCTIGLFNFTSRYIILIYFFVAGATSKWFLIRLGRLGAPIRVRFGTCNPGQIRLNWACVVAHPPRRSLTGLRAENSKCTSTNAVRCTY